MVTKKAEGVVKDLKTKLVYSYVDEEKGINVISKEVFKKGKKEIHYPFSTKNGGQKYKNISKITYEEMPDPLPSGFLKSANTGYGFTKELSPIIFAFLDKHPKITSITVSSRKKSEIYRNQLFLNSKDLESARREISPLLDKHKEDLKLLANNLLAQILPEDFDSRFASYKKGDLSRIIKNQKVDAKNLSSSDVNSLLNLISKISSKHEAVKTRKILDSKETIEKVFIEDIISQFCNLLSQKTETKTLENRWQSFFSDNILYFNFGYVERFEKERIQGDKSINIPDFILLDTYSYLDVFEIKTHLTHLLVYDSGRNNFYWSSEASKAISQAENYIDSMIKEEDLLIKNIRDEYGIDVDAVRPEVIIVASSQKEIAGKKTSSYKGKKAKKMWNDFRRLNNSLKNIQFVLYDELLDVFNNTLKRLKDESNSK